MEGDSDLVRQNSEASVGMRGSGVAPQESQDRSGNTQEPHDDTTYKSNAILEVEEE